VEGQPPRVREASKAGPQKNHLGREPRLHPVVVGRPVANREPRPGASRERRMGSRCCRSELQLSGNNEAHIIL